MLARTQIPAIKRNKPVKGRRGERSDLATAPSTTLALCASAVHYYTMIGEAWISEYKPNIKDSPELSDCYRALSGLRSAKGSLIPLLSFRPSDLISFIRSESFALDLERNLP